MKGSERVLVGQTTLTSCEILSGMTTSVAPFAQAGDSACVVDLGATEGVSEEDAGVHVRDGAEDDCLLEAVLPMWRLQPVRCHWVGGGLCGAS